MSYNTLSADTPTDYFPVVIYARYSSQGQREESIEGQLRECKSFVERNGWTIVGEYIDRALSGKTDKREAFQRMIKDSEKGRFRGVLMYTLDRFARNRYDSAMYKARLKKNGVRVFYAKQSIPDGPEGIILESVLEGYAEYYSENLSRNVRRGMMENALQCKSTGGLCLGYRWGQDGKMEIDPVGAKVVQEIFQLYADGTSATQIINYCNNKGYKTARGRPFGRNSLHTILHNERYVGVYAYEDVRVEDGVPAIISRDLFDRAQAMLKHNYTARAKSKAITDYLLTTKVFCGHCGAPMIGECGTSRHGTTYHYYKCACRKRNGSCQKKTEKKEWLEAFVVKHTVEKALTDENIEEISTKAAALYEKECADTRLLVSLEQSLEDTDVRLKNILDLMEQGIATASTKDRLLELEGQKQDLECKIARERRKKPALTKERIAHWLYSFRGGDIHDPDYQRKVIDTLLNSVYIYDTNDGNGRRFVLSFNLSRNNTGTLTLSDISDFVCFGVPELPQSVPRQYAGRSSLYCAVQPAHHGVLRGPGCLGGRAEGKHRLACSRAVGKGHSRHGGLLGLRCEPRLGLVVQAGGILYSPLFIEETERKERTYAKLHLHLSELPGGILEILLRAEKQRHAGAGHRRLPLRSAQAGASFRPHRLLQGGQSGKLRRGLPCRGIPDL